MTNNLTNNHNKILPNISRSKGNRKITFGQLVKYKNEKYFSRKIIHKMLCKTITRPLSKKSKLGIFLNQQPNVLCILFILYAKLRAVNKNILKLSCRPLAFTSYKAFLKNKKRSRSSLPTSFCYILLTGQISLSGCF